MCFLFLEHVATAKRFFWFVYSVSKKIASFHCYYFSQKQAFVTNSPQVYLGIPSANISLSAWEIKDAGVPLFSYGTGKP